MPLSDATLYGEDPEDPVTTGINTGTQKASDKVVTTVISPIGTAIGTSEQEDKKAEESDKNSATYEQLIVYKTIFAECPLPLICIDDKTKKIIHWNNAASLKFGVPRKTAIGQGLEIIFIPGQISTERPDRIIDNFIKSTRSRTQFGTIRLLNAKSLNDETLIVKVFIFKITLPHRLIVGCAVVDETRQRSLVENLDTKNKQLQAAQRDLKTNNDTLQSFNSDLKAAKQAAEYRMAKAKTQSDVTNKLMVFIICIIMVTLALSAFTRIPDTILSFVKDSSLLLLGILSGAVGGIFGSKDEKTGNEGVGVYQGPIIPTVPMPGDARYGVFPPAANTKVSNYGAKPSTYPVNGRTGLINVPPVNTYTPPGTYAVNSSDAVDYVSEEYNDNDDHVETDPLF